jgi:hypothetical protein
MKNKDRPRMEKGSQPQIERRKMATDGTRMKHGDREK